MAERVIDIDGRLFATNFRGFGKVMTASAVAGKPVDFYPWPLRAHLGALDACVVPTTRGLLLDSRQFSRRVLAHSGVADDAQDAFAPLALWWASGGNTSATALGGDWYECGANRFRLRQWSSGERFQALAHCYRSEADGARFDLGAYLRALLEASVVALDPTQALDELDSGTTRGLLEAIIALNVATPDATNDVFPDTPEVARVTLRLCRALGWTPTQVWETPAAEMDRLLHLLDRVAASDASVDSRSPRLADHPDAVVIRIEDD